MTRGQSIFDKEMAVKSLVEAHSYDAQPYASGFEMPMPA